MGFRVAGFGLKSHVVPGLLAPGWVFGPRASRDTGFPTHFSSCMASSQLATTTRPPQPCTLESHSMPVKSDGRHRTKTARNPGPLLSP